MLKCYIAGKVSGLDEEVYRANFRKAEIAVTIMGYDPVNPVELPHDHDKTWASYMREAIKAMMDCHVLYVLPDWVDSSGAAIEVQLAKDLRMQIIYQQTLLFKDE